MSNRRTYSRKAFTLTEILVAVAIVALLVGLSFPAATRVIGNAKSAGCVSNMRQIGVGLLDFAGENNGFLPRTIYYDSNGVANEFWTTRIKSYLGILNPNFQAGQNVLRCPARPPFDPENGENYTYGLNYGRASGIDGEYYSLGRVQNLLALGNKIFLMADAYGKWTPSVLWPGPSGYWPLTADKNEDGIPDSAAGEAVDYNYAKFIHQNGNAANFFFPDGSVRMYTIRQWSENEDGFWGDPWPQ